MSIQPFVLRDKPTPAIVELLKSVTLGTNGSRYRHLNTEERIKQLYNPLFVSIERSEDRVLANITFCRRGENWYVRYFAFDPLYQSNKAVTRSKGVGLLKQRVAHIFESAENGDLDNSKAGLFYAYIDPRNERSLYMSQNFGFTTAAKIATQTFSRVSPALSTQVKKLVLDDDFKAHFSERFSHKSFYFDHHTFNDSPFYGYYEKDELVAYCKIHRADWVIERLPGKYGSALVKFIPFIPGLRRILNPKSHSFIVVDSVWMKEGKENVLQQLFESVLYLEKLNLMIWWVDTKDVLYQQVKSSIQWGILHKINGANEVDLVVRSKNKVYTDFKAGTYTSGIDFI
jgi:hypothetical protein